MIQFYAPDFAEVPILPETESGHCIRVLRKNVGDTISVTDGKGYRYTAHIREANPKKVKAEIVSSERLNTHWGCRIVLAIAPTKNLDRIEWLLEKATEIGIDEIIPIKCEHNERKVINRERLEKILISAMKQSLKGIKPLLRELTPLHDVLNEPFEGQKFICYCSDEIERHALICEARPCTDTLILIGPEGDFSPDEAAKAMKAGFMPATLGRSRLRTETAGLFAVQAIHTLNQLYECRLQ